MRVNVLLTGLGLLLAIPASAQAPLATVKVQTAPLERRIPRDFVGMSLEVSTAGQGLNTTTNAHNERQIVYALGEPGAPNSAYFQFMKGLGPGVLRLGGNSQDNTCWDAKAAPQPSRCQGPITPALMRLWADAARASGWKLTIGLNLKQNSPAWALREVDDGVARYIPRSSILGLEIGNEPIFFDRDGSRPKPYTWREQGLDFRAYARKFAKDPVARRYPIVGPAACCLGMPAPGLGVWIDTVGPNRLKRITNHSYFGDVCGKHTFSMQQLLDPERMRHMRSSEEQWAAQAHARGLNIALAETNSIACGGMPGVSDAFASAAWGLDWMFTTAEAGYVGINFHTSYRTGGSSYIPIQVYGTRHGGAWSYQNIAQPLYYAMYAFARNASGRALLPVALQTPANIAAYAVSKCADCGVTVFVINKDLKAAGTVSIVLTGSHEANVPTPHWGAARMLLLEAPSLSAKAAQVRYGGGQFNGSGALMGTHWEPVAGDGSYSISLPNAAIAIVRIPAARK